DMRRPAQQAAGVFYARTPVGDILIAIAIVGAVFDDLHSGEWREMRAQWVTFEFFNQIVRQLADTEFVVRIADVDDAAAAAPLVVFDNGKQRIDTVLDIRETTLLPTTIDQLDRCAFDQVEDELSDGSRAADAGGIQRVQSRTHPVEWSEQGEIQSLLVAIGPDHAIQQLLGG